MDQTLQASGRGWRLLLNRMTDQGGADTWTSHFYCWEGFSPVPAAERGYFCLEVAVQGHFMVGSPKRWHKESIVFVLFTDCCSRGDKHYLAEGTTWVASNPWKGESIQRADWSNIQRSRRTLTSKVLVYGDASQCVPQHKMIKDTHKTRETASDQSQQQRM